MKKNKQPDGMPVWFDGKSINEALFCEEFLQTHKIIFTNGAFFTPEGRVTDELPLRGEIFEELKCCAVSNIPRKISNIVELMKLAALVVLKISENAQSGAAREYLAAQGEIEEYRQRVQELQNEIETIQESIEELTTEIERHKKEYSEHGGITIEEWTELHGKLKAEEEKRERLNWQRKLLATDLLPFAIVSELVGSVLPQLQAEKELQTYQALKRSLERDEFSAVLENTVCAMGSQNVKQDSRH